MFSYRENAVIYGKFLKSRSVFSSAPARLLSGYLSTYDGDQIDATSAWKHYTKTLGHASDGSLGVSVGECEALELRVVPDPEPFHEHVLIDFSEHGRRQIEKRSKKLKSHAETRAWLFQP